MRPARALWPSRHTSLFLLVLITTTTAHYQGTLICKQPETQVCLTWLVHSDELQNFNNAEALSSTRTRDDCGFSKVQASSPYQKFYKVLQLNKNKLPKTLHCKRLILIGLFVDWVEVSYALSGTVRFRRQTFTPKGRYRGQTQSQYLAIDRGNGKDEGKAEARSAADSSRASVSGNSGMGQAQSQSIYDPNCEDCYGRPQVEVENLKHPGGPRPVGNGYGQSTGSTWPGVNHGQSNYIPNHAGYNPIDTQGFTPGKGPSTSSGSQRPGFYGPQSKTNDGYGSTGPNDNINYRPPGSYSRPTSNNGNMVPNNRPTDSGTNEYGPNNIGGYDTKNVPGNTYKSPGNVGGDSYRPVGSGTNGYRPFVNRVYDPNGNVAPDTNGVGNIYTSGYPNQGVGSGPLDNTGGNENRYGPGVTSKYGTPMEPGHGSGQGIGQGQSPGQGQGTVPGQGSGQAVGPGYGLGQGRGPGQGSGQAVGPGYGLGQGRGPGQGSGQDVGPGQGSGQAVGPGYGLGQGRGPGQGSGQDLGPGQRSGQAVGPGYGLGQGRGPGQGSGQDLEPGQGSGQAVGPGYGLGQGVGPGQGSGQRLGPGQGSGQAVGPGYGLEQGVGPGQGSGQRLGPGQGSGQAVGPGYGLGQGRGPGQQSGQDLEPGQGSGQAVGPGYGLGQGRGPGQGSGQDLGPGQGSDQAVGPGYGLGQGVGPGQGSGQGLGPGQESGQAVGPGYGLGQGRGPGQGSGQAAGPGYGLGQGRGPGQGSGQDLGPGQELGPGQSSGQGTEYDPYQRGLGTRYEPNQRNVGTVNRPEQHGLGSNPIDRATKWPMASGPYKGPGGSNYYCCFVPNTGTTGNSYPNNYGVPNTMHGQSNVPGGQSGSGVIGLNGVPNQYETSNSPSIPRLPVNQYGTDSSRPFTPGGYLDTGNSNGPATGIHYGPGGGTSTLGQPSQYGTDTPSPLKPGGQLGISSGPNLGSQYKPGQGSGMQPSNYGAGVDSTRPLIPGGQVGGFNGPTGGNPYIPDVRPGNLPNGQTGIGSDPSMPGSQYSTNVGNVPNQQYGTFNPNNHNGGRGEGNPDINNGQPLPGGHYNNGVNGGISPNQYGSGNVPENNLPGSQYNTGIDGTPEGPYSKSNKPVMQYGTNTPQNVPGTQVGTGPYKGQHGPVAQFVPLDNSGLTSPGQQYGTGPDTLGTNSAGRPLSTGGDHNGPVGTDTANYRGSPYGYGSLGGPTGYTGGPNVPGQPYRSDHVKVPSYGNGNFNYNSNIPGGTYQGGNVGGKDGGVSNGQGDGVPNNYNGSPSDGTSGSYNGPYNPRVTGVQNNEYSGGPQNYIDPNSIDGDDSEAEASVAQGINGTIASASSKGGNDKARAQTNVHGTYTGSGSFQAQAQITGDNKDAQSEVSGGKKGASSAASGSGRNNKSQASVQLGSETGSVQTQSQSAGVMHSSNSQVQGSVKGGMADAQAKGPGSTSSQAQIGFTPYKDTDKSNHDHQKTPFAGGGIASAQSSGRTGQSQSQLHGTFKYGITYNGAAQSGASLDKDAVFPNRLSFEKFDVFDENEKNVNVDITETPQSLSTELDPHIETSSTSESYDFANENEVTTTENVIDDTLLNSESSHTHLDHHKTDNSYLSGPTLSGTKKSFSTDRKNPGTDYEFSTVKEELPSESDYDTDEPFNPEGSEESDLVQGEYSNYDEFTRESPTHQSLLSSSKKPLEVRQSTGGNTQHIVLGSLKNHNAEIIQKFSDLPDENKVYLAGERIPGTGGYTVPAGFTGSVKSVASKDNTYVVGYRDSPSQAQTLTLTPGTGKVKYMYPPAYGKHVMPKNLRSLYSPKDDNKYLSVSKSVTRALDNENNIRKQYSHTYYTKSSSCGYFTFTCTMVSSAEGRKKVCKPKIPTNPDGTQIRC